MSLAGYLFGIGTGAFPSWDSRTRRNNLYRDLAVSVSYATLLSEVLIDLSEALEQGNQTKR